jgi:hypothetical protein
MAVKPGHLRVVQELVRAGCQIQSDLRQCPLVAAACRGHSNVCRLATRTGLHVRREAPRGKTNGNGVSGECWPRTILLQFRKHGADLDDENAEVLL